MTIREYISKKTGKPTYTAGVRKKGFINEERTHQGKHCEGKTPRQTLLDGKTLAMEKMLHSNVSPVMNGVEAAASSDSSRGYPRLSDQVPSTTVQSSFGNRSRSQSLAYFRNT